MDHWKEVQGTHVWTTAKRCRVHMCGPLERGAGYTCVDHCKEVQGTHVWTTAKRSRVHMCGTILYERENMLPYTGLHLGVGRGTHLPQKCAASLHLYPNTYTKGVSERQDFY